MWRLWKLTGENSLMAEARRAAQLLIAEFRRFTELNHDAGFMYLLSTGADYKLIGDQQACIDTLHAASLLIGRFNPVGFIHDWDGNHARGFAIIDRLMNLPLLHFVSREMNDPRFAKVAEIQADTAIREFLRPDGSVSHIIEFNPETGARVRKHAEQGYALGTS